MVWELFLSVEQMFCGHFNSWNSKIPNWHSSCTNCAHIGFYVELQRCTPLTDPCRTRHKWSLQACLHLRLPEAQVEAAAIDGYHWHFKTQVFLKYTWYKSCLPEFASFWNKEQMETTFSPLRQFIVSRSVVLSKIPGNWDCFNPHMNDGSSARRLTLQPSETAPSFKWACIKCRWSLHALALQGHIFGWICACETCVNMIWTTVYQYIYVHYTTQYDSSVSTISSKHWKTRVAKHWQNSVNPCVVFPTGPAQ